MTGSANARRGEVTITLDGRPHTLRLTLQGLAELESAFQLRDLAALGERFGSGRLASSDVIAILGAGLRGGGLDLPDTEVARLPFDDGPAGAVTAAMQLLVATFGDGSMTPEAHGNAPRPPVAEPA